MAIAGHVSQKMLAHYSHIRLEAKRWTRWPQIALMWSSKLREADVTSQSTSQMAQIKPTQNLKSLKEMVGPCGLEPQTSTVSR
jgi:hypothetical protein